MSNIQNTLKSKPIYTNIPEQAVKLAKEWYTDIRSTVRWWTYKHIKSLYIKQHRTYMIWLDDIIIKWFIDLWIENSSLLNGELSAHWLRDVKKVKHRNTIEWYLSKLLSLDIIYKISPWVYVCNPSYASMWHAVPKELIALFDSTMRAD